MLIAITYTYIYIYIYNKGLAVILVGERRDSKAYVGAKKKACAEIGVASFGFDYPGDVAQSVIIDKINELNADPAVNGLLKDKYTL